MVNARALPSLNFNHLRCFWAAAKSGSVSGGASMLGVSQPTVSKQIGELEETLGEALFRRSGRSIALTEVGQTVYSYSEEIFSLGQELTDAVRGQTTGRPMRLAVGISDVLPKLLVCRLIEPALRLTQPVRLSCREGLSEALINDLSFSGLDVVLTDSPVPAGAKVYTHHLGTTPMAIYGRHELFRDLRGDFPGCINGAPFLLPTEDTTLRRSVDAWMGEQGYRPVVVGEFHDSAMLKTFGALGHGFFVAPLVLEEEICRKYEVRTLGSVPAITESLFAVTIERRVRHPGVGAIVDAASATLG